MILRRKLFGLSLIVLSDFGPDLIFPLLSPAAELSPSIELQIVGCEE